MNVEEKNVTTDNSTTQGVETDYLDSLGEKDFNGAIYTIRTQSVTGAVSIFNMHCGEITGKVVNDAQYNRDKYIEQRYNVVMEYLETDPNTNGQELANSMFAGDSIGDLIVDSLSEGTGRISILFNNRMLANLLEVPYLQPDREWWSQLMYKNLTINDKLYFTSGDLAPYSYIDPACIYMNLNLAIDYGIDENELYSMVYDGKWTFDELAAGCGLHDYRYAQRLFKRFNGVSMREYRQLGKGITLYHKNPWTENEIDRDIWTDDNKS